MQKLYIQNLKWRYATKKFDTTKKIDLETLNTLLETLRLSPSSFGVQPWKFIVVNNPETREQLTEAAYGQNQVKEASHVIVLCAKTDLVEADVDSYMIDVATKRSMPVENLEGFKKVIMGSVNSQTTEQKVIWNKKQVYLALGFLMSAAAQMNIDSCPMEGFIGAKVDEILDLKKDGLTATIICPIGYRSDEDKYTSTSKVRFDTKWVVDVRN